MLQKFLFSDDVKEVEKARLLQMGCREIDIDLCLHDLEEYFVNRDSYIRNMLERMQMYPD